MMLAQEIMTKDVLSFKETDTLEISAQKLAARGISGAPVVNVKGNVIGVISESDIMRSLKKLVDKEIGIRYMANPIHSLALFALIAQRKSSISQKLFKTLGKTTVEDVMTKPVVTARPDDNVERVVSLMITNNVQRIPIVKDDKLVGIITRADILRAIPELTMEK